MKKYLDPKADLAFKEIFGELEELLDNPETSKALETVEEAAMTNKKKMTHHWSITGGASPDGPLRSDDDLAARRHDQPGTKR